MIGVAERIHAHNGNGPNRAKTPPPSTWPHEIEVTHEIHHMGKYIELLKTDMSTTSVIALDFR